MRTQVLNRNKDFQLCYRKGVFLVSQNIVLYARKNSLSCLRMGITTSKKVGNAVCRSRARRIIRQAWRENEALIPSGLDVVVVARVHITEVKSTVVSHWLKKYGVPALIQIAEGKIPSSKSKTSKLPNDNSLKRRDSS